MDQSYIKAESDFFRQDVLHVAPALIGNIICIKTPDGIKKYRIKETEAYRGEEDMACHAKKGRTKRTDPMYYDGGILYVYLVYGIHWMLNIVSGKKDDPQAALIRGIEYYNGPGKLTKALGIDASFNYENIVTSERIWILKNDINSQIISSPRIGIDYAGDYWKNKNWRFTEI